MAKQMSIFKGWWIVLLCCLAWVNAAQAQLIPATERAALTSFYTATNGAGWTNSAGWNGAAGTECTWVGVTCDPTLSFVTALSLPANNLVGTLPALTGLPNLQVFDVSGNALTGSLPVINGLLGLQGFYASGNALTGAIPTLSGLTALQIFDVSLNQLSGTIPALSGLSALSTFNVSSNLLTGTLPPLDTLLLLQDFNVSVNALTGSIPPLNTLTALRIFSAHSNKLTGSIPPLDALLALQDFQVFDNQLSGSIPPISGLSSLLYFSVALNQLSGAIPAPPTSLVAGFSQICSNLLLSSGNAAVDAAWTAAAGTGWVSCQLVPMVLGQTNLTVGWNLLGNSINAPLDVATTLGDANKVTSVWKWIPATNKWAFYTPAMTPAALATYAAGKGYDVLTTIYGGEGFWVNAKAVMAISLPVGSAVTAAAYSDQLAPLPNKLPAGWSLIATGDNLSPRAFATAISAVVAPVGSVPTSLTTLWAWDSATSNWYFYAPSLDNSAGLTGYLTLKGYLDFAAKTLDPSMGFWVNHP